MPLHKLANDEIIYGYTYLSPADCCYFLGDYRNGNPAMRPLILALKRHESPAIRTAARLFRQLPEEWCRESTFVPIPPSTRNRPCVLAAVLATACVRDARMMLAQQEDTHRSASGWRPPPEYRAQFLALDERLAAPTPKQIILVDDVLTSGGHYVAARMLLEKRFPGIRIFGVFLARVSPSRPNAPHVGAEAMKARTRDTWDMKSSSRETND
jgi:predicted amidophosphoribosyltransferase